MFPEQAQAVKVREAKKLNSLVFCERATGVAQFGAASEGDLDFAVERAAGLLAMQCMARGARPEDFAILAPVERPISERLVARAEELLAEGRCASNATQLSPRQQQILQSVMCNRENKEIASKLNITVRTVKFHISSLLSKFGVDNRAELARRASTMMRPPALTDEVANGWAEAENIGRRDLQPVPMRANSATNDKARSIRFPQRAVSA